MNTPTKFLLTAVLTLGLAVSAQAQTIYNGLTTGNAADAANWSEGLPVATGANAEALFDGSTPGTLNLTLGANLGVRNIPNDDGSYFRFTENQTDAVNIQSSGASRDINVRSSTTVSVFQMDAGAGAVTLGGGTQPMRFVVGNGVGLKTSRFTNDSSSLATFASNVSFLSGGGRSQDYFFLGTGTGGFNIGGPLQVNQAANDATYTARVFVDMNGAAPLTLSGDNSGMTGEFRIQSGTVILGSNNALGTGNIDFRSDTAARVATLRSNGTARTIANNLVFSSSATGGGSILGGAGSGKLTFTGSTNWGAGAKTFTVDSSEVEFQGEWLGANATNRNTWIGTGVSDSILVLSGDRGTADKGIDFGDGLTVRLNHANSLGSDNTRTVQILGAARQSVVELENNITLARTLTVQGRDVGNAAAAVSNRSGNNTFALALGAGGTRYNVDSQAGNLTISSVSGQTGDRDLYVSGAGNVSLPDWNTRRNIVMDGTGVMTISGASSHTGATTINSGTLRLTGGMSATSGIAVASGASFDYDVGGFAFFDRDISGAGAVVVRDGVIVNFTGNNTGHSGTLTVDAGGVAAIDGTNALGSGNIVTNGSLNFWANSTVANNISGSGDVTVGRFGAGTNNVTFSGNNSFAGAMTIGGVDTGDVNVAIEGNHSGGGSITVAADSSLTLADGGSLTFVIGANNVNNSITGAGSIDLDGLFIFDVSGADLTLGNTWTIVGSGFAGINYGGTFDILNFTDQGGGIWTSNNPHYQFDMGSGVLSVVPEPATYALIGGLLALGAVLIRRRMK